MKAFDELQDTFWDNVLPPDGARSCIAVCFKMLSLHGKYEELQQTPSFDDVTPDACFDFIWNLGQADTSDLGFFTQMLEKHIGAEGKEGVLTWAKRMSVSDLARGVRDKAMQDVEPALASLRSSMTTQMKGTCRVDVMNMHLDGLHVLVEMQLEGDQAKLLKLVSAMPLPEDFLGMLEIKLCQYVLGYSQKLAQVAEWFRVKDRKQRTASADATYHFSTMRQASRALTSVIESCQANSAFGFSLGKIGQFAGIHVDITDPPMLIQTGEDMCGRLVAEWTADMQSLATMIEKVVPIVGEGDLTTLLDVDSPLMTSLSDTATFNRAHNGYRIASNFKDAFSKMNSDGCGLIFPADTMVDCKKLIEHCEVAMDVARAVKAVNNEIPQITNIGQRKAKAKQYSDANKNNRWGESINRRLALLVRGSLVHKKEDDTADKKEDDTTEKQDGPASANA